MALLLRLPSFLQIIIPMSLFIAVLIGYGRMYAESEMTVLTATGFSNRRLLGYTMVPGVFFMLLVGFCSLWLSPYGSDRSEEHTSELQSRPHLVCRLLLEKKKNKNNSYNQM